MVLELLVLGLLLVLVSLGDKYICDVLSCGSSMVAFEAGSLPGYE